MTTKKLYPKALSLKSKFVRKPFVHYLLTLTIFYSTSCWLSEETVVTVHRAILHPSAQPTANGIISKSSSNREVLLQASGWVQPDPYEIRIPSLLDGVIDQLFILEGQAVTLGQKVASLIDDDVKLSLNLARAKVLQSKAKEKEIYAEIDMVTEQLYAAESYHQGKLAIRNEQSDLVNRLIGLPKGAVSQADTNQSILKLQGLTQAANEAKFRVAEIKKKKALLGERKESQKAMTNALQVDVEKALLDLNRTLIHSPVSGVVSKLLTSPGRRVMSSMDSPDASNIAVLFEKGKLQAGIDVPLADASKVFVGQDVEIICSFLPEQPIQGKVSRISGEADFQRNTLEIKVRLLKPDERLRPEMLCRAKFFAPQESPQDELSNDGLGVLIPMNLIADISKKNHTLFIVSKDGKTAELVEIQLGKKVISDHISVLSGLKGGEQIILNPPSTLQSGDRIKVVIP